MADLSPAAQAVLDAAQSAYWQHDAECPADAEIIAAAALRAAADQVVPVEVSLRRGMRPGGTGSSTQDEFKQDQRQETRRRLLAIAAELEASAHIGQLAAPANTEAQPGGLVQRVAEAVRDALHPTADWAPEARAAICEVAAAAKDLRFTTAQSLIDWLEREAGRG